jgi:hypothetical protein
MGDRFQLVASAEEVPGDLLDLGEAATSQISQAEEEPADAPLSTWLRFIGVRLSA